MNFPISALATSAIIISVLIVIRQLLIRAVKRKSDVLSKDQRRWISRIKNSTIILIIFALILVWAPQLQALALSLTAVAVALVIATKEMILCLTGAFMRVTATPFRIGDWITVDHVSGEVVDVNAFAFKIQEIDVAGKSYRPTGKLVDIPNSKLFTSNIENLTFLKKYVYIEVPVTVQYGDFSPEALLGEIEKIVTAHYAPLAEDARKYNRNFEKKAGFDIPDPDPFVSVRTTDIGHIVYTTRAFVPTAQTSNFYRLVARDVLAYVHSQLKKEKKK